VTVTTTSPITTATTTAATGNWWDSLGTPQYGGTMTIPLASNPGSWDEGSIAGASSLVAAYLEPLWSYDWTVNPTTFSYQTSFTPFEYTAGQLAQTYEMPDPNTLIFHLRHGIRWQNIPPANGRELTADDVAFHYDRFCGTGHGFTTPNFIMQFVPALQALKSVTADGNYTVVFKFNSVSLESIYEALLGQGIVLIESPDQVKQYGDTTDWHHAIGTGPFIVTDFVSGSSATLVKNPNYWGYDERYPQNKLPYVDTLQYLIMTDKATRLAAFRTGKIDVMDGMLYRDAQNLQKTNPATVEIAYPPASSVEIDMRVDLAPFNNIKVREAMQMAINLPELAQSYYAGTVDPSPESLTSQYLTGWGYPYSQWPQSLKDEYTYNPTQAKALLTAANLSTGFHTNVVAMNTADLDLLQLIQGYFAAVNITMDIRTMDPASWNGYVQTSHKEDGLMMKDVGNLGNTIPPVTQLVAFYSKNTATYEVINDPNYNAIVDRAELGTASLDDVKQALKDANELIATQHYSIALNNVVNFAFSQPWLKGFNEQSQSISGIFTFGAAQYFWLPRYWIDKNMK